MEVMKEVGFSNLVNDLVASELSALRIECEESIQAAYKNFKEEAFVSISKLETRYKETLQEALTKAAEKVEVASQQYDMRGSLHSLNGGEESGVIKSNRSVFKVEEHPADEEVLRGNMKVLPELVPDSKHKHKLTLADRGPSNKVAPLVEYPSESLPKQMVPAAEFSNMAAGDDRESRKDSEVNAIRPSSPGWELAKTLVGWGEGPSKKRRSSRESRVVSKRQTFQEMVEIISGAGEQIGTRSNSSSKINKEFRRLTIRERMDQRRYELHANSADNKQSGGKLGNSMTMRRRNSSMTVGLELMKMQSLDVLDIICHALVMDEHTYFRKTWDVIIFTSLVYCCFSIPFQLAFVWPEEVRNWSLFMRAVNDVVFNLDILFNFFTAHINADGIMEYGLVEIAREYASTWLVMDVLSSVPFDRIVNIFSQDATWPAFLRLLRILTLFKFDKRFKRIERHIKHPFKLRLLKSGLTIACAVHWFACLVHVAVMSSDKSSADEWIGQSDFRNQGYGHKYVTLVYWVSVSMIGESSSPQETPQVVLSLIVFWGGLLMYFSLCSNLVNIMTNMNLPSIEFNKKNDRRLTFMKHMKLPKEIKIKVLDHFKEAHKATKGVDTQEFLKELPYHLRQEVAFHLTKHSLDLFPSFDQCPLPLLSALMMRIKLTICAEGDVLCIEGDFGHHMFFVLQGELEVFKMGQGKVGTLTQGSIFGEAFMLEGNLRRNATVKATKACVLYALHRNGYHEIRQAYPEHAEEFIIRKNEHV